jgi:hypothetical protein
VVGVAVPLALRDPHGLRTFDADRPRVTPASGVVAEMTPDARGFAL